MRDKPAHWIKENYAARVPQRHVVIDTEARAVRRGNVEVQTWRVGVACFLWWTSKGTLRQYTREYGTAEAMWRDISGFTRPRERTVVWAHNMPYDMRVSRALELVPRLGWSVAGMRFASRGSWSSWRAGEATLCLADSASIFPTSLELLGRTLGMGKLAMPTGDDDGAWLARCRRDVEILAAGVVEYLSWLREGHAGNWQLTGASQSWAHWRHSHYTHRVLVHDDEEVLSAEREAMWTGRAEAWSWGRQSGRYVYEYDWANAYPRIAAGTAVPSRLNGPLPDPTWAMLRRYWGRVAVLAEVSVRTPVPVVPMRCEAGIIWPVGEFTTTLWDPELRLLGECGAEVRVHRAWHYSRAPVLADWAEWILAELHDGGRDCPAWRKLVLKHWSRSLIGRFAMRHDDWELLGRAPVADIRLGDLAWGDRGVVTQYLQVGRDVFERTGLRDVDDACPQITGYIMSAQRAKLWRAAMAIGAECVLYMDTDSLIVSTNGDKRIRALSGSELFDGLRLKRKHRGYEIYGPRAYIVGDTVKFAGIPRGAVRIGDTAWEGSAWESLETSIQAAASNEVRISTRKFRVRWNGKRRALQDNGRTVPYRMPDYVPGDNSG